MVANGQLEALIATVELQFEVSDIPFHSHDKPYKPFDRSLNPTMQQCPTRYASRNLELSLLFNAIKIRRLDITKCY